jgi:signal transduction histidine kinase
MKLALKVVLASVLGTLAVLAMFGWFRVEREVALFDSDMRKDHGLIAATLAVSVANTWPSLGPDRVIDLIRRADAERPGLQLAWIHPDGRSSAGPPVFPKSPVSKLVKMEQIVREDPSAPDRHYLVTRVPVRANGQVLGAIGIAEATVIRDNYIRSTVRNSVLATIAMIATSGIGVLVLGVWLVGRPLRLLANKAKRVGQGDLSGALDLRQNDEIGELAHEVNSMCERLAEANARTQAETAARIQTLEQLRHADRLITVGRLAAGIAHELGTPLNVIVGRVKMLRRGDVEPPVAAEYLSVVSE